MELENYEAVLAVYQFNGWTEAAYQTNQSPSTISKRVSRVEAELGAPIFQRRKGSGVVLTEFGELMLPYIQRMTSIQNHVNAYVSRARGEGPGELTVGYTPLMGTVGESEILSRFKADNPNVVLNHVLRYRKELLFMLQEGKLDCAFVLILGGAQISSDLLDVLLSNDIAHIPTMRREAVNVGLSLAHPLADQREVRMRQLYGDTFVFNSSPDHRSMDQGDMRFIFSQELERHISLKVTQMDFINHSMVARFVADNKGVLPTACIPPTDLPGVRFLPLVDVPFSSVAIFAYPRRGASPQVKTLLKYVRAYARERGITDELE